MRTMIQAAIILPCALFFSGNASSADVCCLMAKVVEKKVLTISLPMSPLSCKKGLKAYESYEVCLPKEDPDNTCPQLTDEIRCKECGYFWNGSCLTEDPVEKAKEEIKNEEAEKLKKQKKDKKE